jgi:predicted acetyltransferase
MTNRGVVALDRAARAEAGLLGNLLELYLHDLSAAFPVIELGPDGRFGYDRLDLYWSEPERRFPFLIRCDTRVVGFALATRGSPVAEDQDVFDVAEFFVIRRVRRSGIGQRAAQLLWETFPGQWTVRASEGNLGAVPFWARTVAQFSGGRATESTRSGSPHAWRVYSFRS